MYTVENIVEVKNLSKRYGKFSALSNISFSVPRGKIIGLIGPNGAGKTSLLKILSGIMPATLGEVIVDGVSMSANPDLAKKNIAFMPENNPLPDHMRVGEYLRFRADLKGIKDIRRCVEKIMRKCDIYYDARYKIIKTLSKGYRQRVGIADALLGDQSLVILDEPTIGLDPRQIIMIRKALLELRGAKTLVISSHILSELETICDYYVIINNGKIVTLGDFDDITKLNIESEIMCADIKCSSSENEVNKFFTDQKFKDYSIQFDNNKDVYHVTFQIEDKGYVNTMHSIVDFFKDNLVNIGQEHSSLEDVFLCATKRSRDE